MATVNFNELPPDARKKVLRQFGYTATRKSKYGNKKVTVNGKTFDSKKEADRYCELLLMQRAGEISHLETQKVYELIPCQYRNGKCVELTCKYLADFVYIDKDGNTVVEDTKGFRTPEYKIKRKLMLYVHGIQIREI